MTALKEETVLVGLFLPGMGGGGTPHQLHSQISVKHNPKTRKKCESQDLLPLISGQVFTLPLTAIGTYVYPCSNCYRGLSLTSL